MAEAPEVELEKLFVSVAAVAMASPRFCTVSVYSTCVF